MRENIEYGREDEAHTEIDGYYQGEKRDGDQRAGGEDQGVLGELSPSSGRYGRVDPSFGQTPARFWANGNTVKPESGSTVYAEQQTVMEYGVPSFVVSDQALEQNFGENAPPAVTSEGQIYFRQTLPEKNEE